MTVKPEAGLVINYDFVWKDEAAKGRIEGKDRPCMIVQLRKAKDDDRQFAYILPITHTPPGPKESGVEIPHQVARNLGLDDERMWIKTHEINRVEWPDNHYPFGVTPNRKGNMSYGVMRHDIGVQAFQQVAEQARNRTLAQVNRDEDIEQAKEPQRRPTRRQTGTPQQRTDNPRGRGGRGKRR